jgi:GxxExxY protein
MYRDIAGHDALTSGIIGCGIRVHEALGPGLLESVYRHCVVIELEQAGYRTDTTRRIPLIYRGHDIGVQFCPDVIVEDTVIVELKAVEALARIHKSQLVTYLKLTGLPVGLLMNFNVELLRDGVRRVVRPDLYVKG